jgi:hypothetical protein
MAIWMQKTEPQATVALIIHIPIVEVTMQVTRQVTYRYNKYRHLLHHHHMQEADFLIRNAGDMIEAPKYSLFRYEEFLTGMNCV